MVYLKKYKTTYSILFFLRGQDIDKKNLLFFINLKKGENAENCLTYRLSFTIIVTIIFGIH